MSGLLVRTFLNASVRKLCEPSVCTESSTLCQSCTREMGSNARQVREQAASEGVSPRRKLIACSMSSTGMGGGGMVGGDNVGLAPIYAT